MTAAINHSMYLTPMYRPVNSDRVNSYETHTTPYSPKAVKSEGKTKRDANATDTVIGMNANIGAIRVQHLLNTSLRIGIQPFGED